MKSDKSILTALLDEMESLSKEKRSGVGGRIVAAVAAVVVAVLGAGAAYVLLGPARRRKLQRRIASASRTSVRRVKTGLRDLGVLHARRSSSNGARGRRRTSRVAAR